MNLVLALLMACTGASAPGVDSASSTDGGDTAADGPVAWTRSLAPLPELITAPRGWQPARAIVHLHSPWSHDACDGEPLDEGGAPRRDCLADLRSGLCDAGIDHAFLTDHPSHFATGSWDEVFLAEEGDRLLPDESAPRAVAFSCDDGREVRWYPGVEDDLMPVALDTHVPGDAAERDHTYNQADAATLEAFAAAGGLSLVAHTEGRDVATLQALVADGLHGVEVFNLHAMFDPRIRSGDLGLDASDWLAEMATFTAEDATAEPDLFVLAVLERQPPSEEAWDALNATGPDDRVVVATAGTDAHQNVFPVALSDGERGDSYRRMLRWFSQHLWLAPADDGSIPLDAAEQALAAGRFHVVFEVLGTPADFDLHLVDAAGTVHEMGSALDDAVLPAELVVGCPTLAPGSPRGADAPEISVTVLRDGVQWADGCGTLSVEEPGTYRVRVDQTPWHLAPFLGDDPSAWMRSYPWIYSNPIRIRSAAR